MRIKLFIFLHDKLCWHFWRQSGQRMVALAECERSAGATRPWANAYFELGSNKEERFFITEPLRSVSQLIPEGRADLEDIKENIQFITLF